jgi:hypothetical protein
LLEYGVKNKKQKAVGNPERPKQMANCTVAQKQNQVCNKPQASSSSSNGSTVYGKLKQNNEK